MIGECGLTKGTSSEVETIQSPLEPALVDLLDFLFIYILGQNLLAEVELS